MFETAELGQVIAPKEFRKISTKVREQLLELQERLRKNKSFQVILVFAGVDGAGKSEAVALLNQWMDARWLSTCAYDELTASESERPEFWRYWRDLPPRGRIGMFLSAWYSQPVLDRVHRNIDEATFIKHIERIAAFENALVEDGALIMKFWMHLSKDAQEVRLKSLEDDPLTSARVNERDWENWKIYENFIEAAEQVIARTNRGKASWTIVEGVDSNYRNITVTSMLRDALHRKFAEHDALRATADLGTNKGKSAKNKEKTAQSDAAKSNSKERAIEPALDSPHPTTILRQLDMNQSVSKQEYRKELRELQARLYHAHLQAREQGVSSILTFEGPDAAGKGGVIRRITNALQPRNYQVHGIAAPTEEEFAQHYLWRFWRHLSRAGRVTIFDRSWYGRVLVERIEGFAKEEEWRRAYAEINDFEAQLVDHGIVLLKFWIHVDSDEQLARFKARELIKYKRWKLTEEDWRNREKWDDYEEAVHDMVQYTSTQLAPWHLIEGNDKRFARLKVLRTVCEKMESVLGA